MDDDEIDHWWRDRERESIDSRIDHDHPEEDTSFFCARCGATVAWDAKSCPRCGACFGCL